MKFAVNLKINNDSSGFSTIELIFVLPIVIGLILISNAVLNHINNEKRNNQLADHIKVYQSAAIMYINDNYRAINISLKRGDIILPANGIAGYYYKGVNSMLSIGQSPCLYITKNRRDIINSPFKAYLIFGNSASKIKTLSFKDAMKVADSVGGNAGVMDPGINGFKIRGVNSNENTTFNYNLNIGTECGWTGGHGNIEIPDYSIVVDLTENKRLFMQLVNENDSSYSQNPSLKNIGVGDDVTMRANLFMDNVVKESSTQINYYCDPSHITKDSSLLCKKYAVENNLVMTEGTNYWASSIKTGDQSCTGTAKATFYKNILGCNGVNYPDPNNYCDREKNGKQIVVGSATWNPYPAILQGDECISTAVATYQIPSCDFACTAYYGGHNIYFCGDKINKLCNDLGNSLWPTATGSVLHTTFENGMCHVKNLSCRNTADNYGGPINTYVTPNWIPENNQTPCNQYFVPAIPNSIQPLGEITCGVDDSIPAIKSTIISPAQHRYRALDFGAAPILGQRVEIKSDMPAGPATDNSRLTLNNAGIQSGYIAPISHQINVGDPCQASELGAIAEQLHTTTFINSQLQCTYSPVYCQGTGYCYEPLKAEDRLYNFATLQIGEICPAGSIVAAYQPSDGIATNVHCPDYPGYTLIMQAHGETTNCYPTQISAIEVCTGYQTLCTYKNSANDIQKISIAALAKLKCTSAANTFTIKDYSQ